MSYGILSGAGEMEGFGASAAHAPMWQALPTPVPVPPTAGPGTPRTRPLYVAYVWTGSRWEDFVIISGMSGELGAAAQALATGLKKMVKLGPMPGQPSVPSVVYTPR